MPARTYSDKEAVEIIRGSATKSDIEWLHRHLRGDDQPQLPGFKAGRKWRLTEDDITEAIELLRPARTERVSAAVDIPNLSSLTRTSRRRLAQADHGCQGS